MGLGAESKFRRAAVYSSDSSKTLGASLEYLPHVPAKNLD